MAKAEKFTFDELSGDLSKLKALPDDTFIAVMTDDDGISQLQAQLENLIKNSNARVTNADFAKLFSCTVTGKNVIWNDDRKSLICGAIAYYNACLLRSDSQFYGKLCKPLAFINQEESSDAHWSKNKNLEWLRRICNIAGIETISLSTNKSKREKRLENIEQLRTPAPDGNPKTMLKIENVKPDRQEPDVPNDEKPVETDEPTVLVPDSIFDCTDIIPKKYIVDGTIEAGSIVMIAGKEKIGKTYTLEHLALSMSAELPWMGKATMQDEKGGILWVNLDMKRDTARRRTNEITHGICEGLGKPFQPQMFSNFYMIHSETFRKQGFDSLTFDGNAEKTILEMERFIKDSKYNIKVCFIDSLIEIIGSLNENDSGDIGRMFQRIYQIRDETGCTFILIHHNTKYGERGRGSSAIFSSTETNLQLSEDISNSDKLILTTDGARDTAKNDIGMLKVWKPRLNDDGTEMKDSNGHTVFNFTLETIDANSITTSKTEKTVKKKELSDKRYEQAVLKALENEFEGLNKTEIKNKAHIDKQESNRAIDRLYETNCLVLLENGKYKLP